MSDNKWTPGPWVKCNTADIFTGLGGKNAEGTSAPSNDGWHVADCDMGGLCLDEVRGNANLIAAAPDLYDALDCIIALVEHCKRAHLACPISEGQYEGAKLALAKARGEQQ